MALFQRNKNKSVMPEEVRDFYASERRDRKGMAWLLAIATLLVTFVIAAALFFGGRWIYRTVFDKNDENAQTSQEEQAKEATPAETAKPEESKQSGNDQPANNPSANSPANTPNQPNSGTPGSPTGTSSTNTAQTPVTGPNELVDTGPGDEL